MFDKLRNAVRHQDDGGLPRKTTEVRLPDDTDAMERAHTTEPALVLVDGDLPGQVFRLRIGRQIIGRRPECDIRVRERAVSGIHAEVVRDRDEVTITDLASTNGTLVNGTKIRTAVPLRQGSLVTIGACVFRYVDSLLEVEFTETLHARSITDPLTGAFNRAYLVARLGFAVDSSSPLHPVSVIAFDLDDFKLVNDRFGHPAGDHLLKQLTQLVSGTYAHEGQVFARVGGEEFVLMLPDTAHDAAMERAEQIRNSVAHRSFVWDASAIAMTASFGVSSTANFSESAEALLARADEQLYRAKREGRNRVCG